MIEWFRRSVKSGDWAYLVAVLLSFFIVFVTGELATSPNNDTDYPLVLAMAGGCYVLLLLLSMLPPWILLRIAMLISGNVPFAAIMFGVKIK